MASRLCCSAVQCCQWRTVRDQTTINVTMTGLQQRTECVKQRRRLRLTYNNQRLTNDRFTSNAALWLLRSLRQLRPLRLLLAYYSCAACVTSVKEAHECFALRT